MGDIPEFQPQGVLWQTDPLQATEARLGGEAGYRDASFLSQTASPSPMAAKPDLIRSQLLSAQKLKPLHHGFHAACDFDRGLCKSRSLFC